MSNKYTSVYDWLKYIKANVVGINLRELRIIIWLCVNYGIFVLVFLVLGTLGSEYKAILWINFFLDIAICVISLVLNIILFFQSMELLCL